MTKNPYIRFAGRTVPQNEQARPDQVKNNAGGYVFQVSEATQLQRFLILGTVGGTYYQNEDDLTKKNLNFVIELCKTNPQLVLSEILSVVNDRRALRMTPALFTLALLFANVKEYKGEDKSAVYAALRDSVTTVCKTSTQLFEFVSYVDALSGWSRSDRTAVTNWYTSKSDEDLAYQMVKYRQRNGWTHADLLRLSHARVHPSLERLAGRWYKPEKNDNIDPEHAIVRAFLEARRSTAVREVLAIMRTDDGKRLPWEALPTEVLTSADVWKMLFENGQLRNQALIRNVTRMARIGAFNDMTFMRQYADKLVEESKGLHPLNYLNAYLVYTQGQINRRPAYGIVRANGRTKNWDTHGPIVDALNAGFYDSFQRITPTGKRFLLAIDVSGSMASAAPSGLDMTCAQLCGAMAMSIARIESNYIIRGFSANRTQYSYSNRNQPMDGFVDLGISASTDLNTAFAKVQMSNFGRTDCAIPMLWAEQNNVEVDAFVVLTDNETWFGNVHPHEALERYRQKMGINAAEIVVAATATPFSIADPNDPKTLDVVGADSNLPKLIQEFVA